MNEINFKVGERVFDVRFGFGTVVELSTRSSRYPLAVKYESHEYFQRYSRQGISNSGGKTRSLWHADLVALQEHIEKQLNKVE